LPKIGSDPISGVMETDGEVHHLIADRVHDFSELAGG
jgi:hypothetical protein